MRVLHLGLPDGFVEHGSREQILAECGLDAESIRGRIRSLLGAEDLARTDRPDLAVGRR